MKLQDLIEQLQNYVGHYPEPEIRIGLPSGEIVGVWRISPGRKEGLDGKSYPTIVIEAEDPNDKE